MKHDLYTDADNIKPAAICDRNGQVVLAMCKRCGKSEAELGPSCAAFVEADLFTLFISGTIEKYQLVGSTYVLGSGRDIDYAVLLAPASFSVTNPSWKPEWLTGRWVREGAEHYEGNDFVSFRQGDINIIVMHDAGFYDRFLKAMEVCAALELKTRKERVIVCRIVRDGMSAAQATGFDIPGEQE